MSSCQTGIIHPSIHPSILLFRLKNLEIRGKTTDLSQTYCDGSTQSDILASGSKDLSLSSPAPKGSNYCKKETLMRRRGANKASNYIMQPWMIHPVTSTCLDLIILTLGRNIERYSSCTNIYIKASISFQQRKH